jgi:hypothetical protein
MKNGFPAPNKELAKTKNNHLTGKAPYKFESAFLQRGVTSEPFRERSGTYWARVVVPADYRVILGRTEYLEKLGRIGVMPIEIARAKAFELRLDPHSAGPAPIFAVPELARRHDAVHEVRGALERVCTLRPFVGPADPWSPSHKRAW